MSQKHAHHHDDDAEPEQQEAQQQATRPHVDNDTLDDLLADIDDILPKSEAEADEFVRQYVQKPGQ